MNPLNKQNFPARGKTRSTGINRRNRLRKDNNEIEQAFFLFLEDYNNLLALANNTFNNKERTTNPLLEYLK